MARMNRDKKGYWYIDYTYQGKRTRKGCGHGKEGKAAAEILLAQIKLDIAHNKLGIVPEIPAKEFFARYLGYAQANKAKRSYERDLITLKNFLPYIEGKELAQVRASDIEYYKTARLKLVTKGTINRELNTIKAAFNKALEWGLLTKNPLRAVKKFKEPRGLPRFFSLEEINRILNAATGELRAAIFLLFQTGMRRDELIHLEWTDIDYKRNCLYVQPKADWNPKDYEARAIPLNSQLKELLLSMENKGRYVITGYHPASLSRAFRRVLQKTGIKNASLHTLRHTYASHLVMSGVDLATVRKLLGHSDIKTTMRYAHLAPDHLQEAAQKLGQAFCHFSAVEKAQTGTKGNIREVNFLGKSTN